MKLHYSDNIPEGKSTAQTALVAQGSAALVCKCVGTNWLCCCWAIFWTKTQWAHTIQK